MFTISEQSLLFLFTLWRSFILIHHVLQVTTTIGFGSPNKANSYSVHGAALGASEVDATRKNLGWPYEPFHVPEDVKKYEYLSFIMDVLLFNCCLYFVSELHLVLFTADIGAAIPLMVLHWKLSGIQSLPSMKRSMQRTLLN